MNFFNFERLHRLYASCEIGYSFCQNSKVSFLNTAKNEAEFGPNFKVRMGAKRERTKKFSFTDFI